MSNPKEANFRIVRYEGQYRVEVLDKPIGWWYIVASKMTWEQAVKWCYERFVSDGFNEYGFNLKRLGEMAKERGEKKLTADEIKRIVNIADNLLQDKNAKDKYISEEQYYEEVLKQYNNE